MKATGSEPKIELACVGIRIEAKGALAVVIVALLAASWMALRANAHTGLLTVLLMGWLAIR